MTKAKKLTAIDAPELTQEHVNTITDPRMRAALQNMLDIVKDAPPIPGLVELEEKFGVGKIPMLAVHESKLLSLKDKKILFSIAGYEYDGTLPEKPTVEAEEADEQYDTFYTETAESYESLIYHDTIGALAGYPFDGSAKQLANREAIRAWGLAELPDFKLSAKRLKDAVALAPELRSKLAVAAQKVEM